MKARRERATEAWRFPVAVLALSMVAAAVAFALWRLSAPADTKPAATPWRGIWPQDSHQEAEQAQLAADRADPRSSWQLGFDPDAVVYRYAREVLGWRNPQPLVDNIGPEWVRETLVIECAPGPHPEYPEIDCGLPEDRIYSAVTLTVERLVRHDRGGIWIVTRVEPTDFHQPAPPSARAVRALVNEFLQRRMKAAGAEAYVSAGARSEFGKKAQLGPLYSGHARSEIAFVDGPLWPSGSFEVGVRLFYSATGRIGEETLFVGRGSGLTDEPGPLVVLGGRPGLEGP